VRSNPETGGFTKQDPPYWVYKATLAGQ